MKQSFQKIDWDNEDEGPLCCGKHFSSIWVKELGLWKTKINSHHDDNKGEYITPEDQTSNALSEDEKISEDDIPNEGHVEEKETEEDIQPAPVNVEHEAVNNSHEGDPMGRFKFT
ncbi:hypothetical protein Tco_0116066 [Tanacetum coccineum]